MNIHLLDPL